MPWENNVPTACYSALPKICIIGNSQTSSDNPLKAIVKLVQGFKVWIPGTVCMRPMKQLVSAN